MSVCMQGYIHRHRKRGRRYGWQQEQVVRVYSHIYDSHISVRYICMYSMYIKVYIWVRKNKKEWFHPGSIRGPSPRQDDVITNYTMKPFKEKIRKGQIGKWQSQCKNKKNAPDRVRTSDLQIFSLTLLPAELQELTIKRTKKDRLGLQVRSNRQKKQSREKVRHIAQENKRRVGRYVCLYVCMHVCM